VVASPIAGNPEVVQTPAAGEIAAARTPAAIAEAMLSVATTTDRAATRAYAERFGWGETSAGQIEIFERVVRK
jgi:glycosyltransferase involved in cell wall biosynthesis